MIQQKIKNIAHRGSTKDNKYADNSMKAFQRAVKKKFDGFELDIYLTKDLVPVLIHEKGLEVGTVELINSITFEKERIKIKEISYQELKEFLLVDRRQKICSLQELLEEIKNQKLQINLDFKDNSEECYVIVLQMISQIKPQATFNISTFEHKSIEYAKEWIEKLCLKNFIYSFLFWKESQFENIEFYQKHFQEGNQIIIDIEFIVKRMDDQMEKFKGLSKLGYEIHAYAVSEFDQFDSFDLFENFLSLGITGYVNNNPELVHEFNMREIKQQ